MCVCDDITQAGYAIGNYCINNQTNHSCDFDQMFPDFSHGSNVIPSTSLGYIT